MKTVFNFLFFFSCFINAQHVTFLNLEKQVMENNNSQKFDSSIQLITDFVSDDSTTSYDKYSAYLLKAFTYKALFNYDETFKALDMALKEGLKSIKVEEVKATIKAEKAFVYFDLQKYDNAYYLMTQLRHSNYKNLDLGNTAYIIMQEGYIDYLNKKYTSAESKFDEAILIMEKVRPENLPVIYGKKMELYKMTGNHKMSSITFNLGIESAQKSKIIKYEIYIYEQLREQQMFDNNWKSAFKTYQIIEELKTKYDADGFSSKLKLLEKDNEIQKKDFELSKDIIFHNSLIVISLTLLVGLYLSIRLYKSNKQKSLLIEKEYKRIYEELEILTKNLTDQGITKINFAKFNLSERQLEIIELIRKGKSNKEIGIQLFISENTVKYHLKAIYDILNIENRREFFKLIN